MSRPQVHLAEFQGFSCTSCGLCCTRPWNIRIEPEVEAGIRGSAMVAQREREGYQPLEVLENGRVNAHRQRNGDCMFLKEDVMCGLHSELGSTGKPIGCQLYPYRATTTPLGTYFTLSFACPPVVAGLDQNVEENRADLEAVLERWPQAADHYEEVNLASTSDIGITWQSYQMLEEWMLETFDPRAPLDSLLNMAATISAIADGEMGWPPDPEPVLDRELLRDLLTTYMTAIVSILENEKDHEARGPYGLALAEGERMPSCYFDGSLPVLDLDRTLPDWALETHHRYFKNQIMGKAVMTPSVVSKLLAMAIGYAMLTHYAEGLREAAGEDELSLLSLTRAFEIVEGDVVSHGSGLIKFFRDFEETLPKFFGL